MREVIVTVGTRGSGKSTFCEKALALDPSFVEVSRDKILLKVFNGTYLDPYGGGHFFASEKMWAEVTKHLFSPDLKMILDTWNGDRHDRWLIARKLRDLGADRVVAWYFTTPVETVEEWFWQKPGIAKSSEMLARQGQGLVFFSEDAPRRDHEMFHRLAAEIDTEGFDEVVRINPLVLQPESALSTQTSPVT